MIDDARRWIDENVVSRDMSTATDIPPIEAIQSTPVPADAQEDAEMTGEQQDKGSPQRSVAAPVKPFGSLDVEAVQIFQPTAPPESCGPAFPGTHSIRIDSLTRS